MRKLALMCFLLLCETSESATILVSSFGDRTGSFANATAAYNASANGDTIIFPSGTNTWSSGLVISKQLSIIGAGSGVGGTTIITSGSMANGVFNLTSLTNSGLVRISGFFFEGSNWTPQWILKLFPNNDVPSLRLDHCVFDYGSVGVEMNGCKGVVDHCSFYNGDTKIYYSAGQNYQASNSWNSPIQAGTGNAMFVEDCLFQDDANYNQGGGNNSQIETYNGGRIVIRHNTFDGSAYPIAGTWFGVGFHGNAAGGLPANEGYWEAGFGARRGQCLIEVYQNSFNAKRLDYMLGSRGGSMLIWSNTLTETDSGTPLILLREEEYSDTADFSPLRTAWPAEDQIYNTFIWSNVFKGVLQSSSNIQVDPNDAAPNEKIKLGRDYWLNPPLSSGGLESFTGSNGASGTSPTDGITYTTLGTMTFSGSGANAYYPYTSYIYPHPLVTGSSAALSLSGATLQMSGATMQISQ